MKKWRKPSVYQSRIPLANLHEELKQQWSKNTKEEEEEDEFGCRSVHRCSMGTQ